MRSASLRLVLTVAQLRFGSDDWVRYVDNKQIMRASAAGRAIPIPETHAILTVLLLLPFYCYSALCISTETGRVEGRRNRVRLCILDRVYKRLDVMKGV